MNKFCIIADECDLFVMLFQNSLGQIVERFFKALTFLWDDGINAFLLSRPIHPSITVFFCNELLLFVIPTLWYIYDHCLVTAVDFDSLVSGKSHRNGVHGHAAHRRVLTRRTEDGLAAHSPSPTAKKKE